MSEESSNFIPGKPPRIVTVVTSQKAPNTTASHQKFNTSNSKKLGEGDNLKNNYINKMKMSPCCSLIKKTIDNDLDELEEYGIPSSPAKNLKRSSSLYTHFGDEPDVSPIHNAKELSSIKFRKESKSTPPTFFNDPQFSLNMSPIKSLSDRLIKVKDIQKLIKVQSIVRRWLVIHNFRVTEEKRAVDRVAYQSLITDNYNKEIERITKLINEGKKCEQLDQAKQLIEEYANIILNNDPSFQDYDVYLKYLFNLCDESQLGSINKTEFLLLLNQLLGISESLSSYTLLFPMVDSRIDYLTFCTWFISKEEFHIYSSIRKRVSSFFSKRILYPYITHIKCVLHIEMVVNKMNDYDKNNSPNFRCSNCGYVSYSPLILSKHIIQCKLDKKMEDVIFD